MDIFKDDATGMWSLSRLIATLIVIYCMGSMWGKDIPIGWAGLASSLYLINKGASTILSYKGVPDASAPAE